jgi:frataxin
MPDTDNPSPPKVEEVATTLTAAEITDEEFHTLSDAFLEKVHEKAEQVQEGREDVEVDYSVSVLFPSRQSAAHASTEQLTT